MLEYRWPAYSVLSYQNIQREAKKKWIDDGKNAILIQQYNSHMVLKTFLNSFQDIERYWNCILVVKRTGQNSFIYGNLWLTSYFERIFFDHYYYLHTRYSNISRKRIDICIPSVAIAPFNVLWRMPLYGRREIP